MVFLKSWEIGIVFSAENPLYVYEESLLTLAVAVIPGTAICRNQKDQL